MNEKITAANLCKAIGALPKNQYFDYLSSSKSRVKVISVSYPEGPIKITRYATDRGSSPSDKTETISSTMLWRVANAIAPDLPINLDRVLGASYNTRSALETLIVHTPEFYYCYPGRVENTGVKPSVKKGHKHLLWQPSKPHKNGVSSSVETKFVVSELPSVSAIYEALVLPEKQEETLDIAVQRRHAQIQIALLKIGQHLQFRTHIAKNDHSILYNERRIGEMDGVIQDLHTEKVISSHTDGVNAAKLIDCVWFRNSRFMPAVIEIEQSTGVRSGLVRMKNFQDLIPPLQTRWVIAAPDEDREKVLQNIRMPQFESLQAKFFPYSAIEELYSLCQRRKIRGVNDEFLDCFME
jgi:type II restriction enzyme